MVYVDCVGRCKMKGEIDIKLWFEFKNVFKEYLDFSGCFWYYIFFVKKKFVIDCLCFSCIDVILLMYMNYLFEILVFIFIYVYNYICIIIYYLIIYYDYL